MLRRLFVQFIHKLKEKTRLKSYLETSQRIQIALKTLSFHKNSNKNETFVRLNNTAFWQTLAKKHADPQALLTWQTLWQQLAPYAHLSTQQLLSLWRKEVFLIESACEWSLHFEPELLDGPFFQKTIKVLSDCKTKILFGLKFRALMATQFEWPDEADDVINLFAIKLNALGLLEVPLVVKENPHNTLTYDARIEIVDSLKSVEDAISQSEQADMLQPVPKKGVLPTILSDDRKKSKRAHQDAFEKRVISYHGTKHWAESFQRVLSQWQESGWHHVKMAVKKMLGVNWVRLIERLYQFRLIFYMGMSLSLYAVLMAQCQLWVFPLLSQQGIKIAINMLFYAIGCLPLSLMAFKWMMAGYAWLKAKVIHSKHVQLMDGFILLDYQHKMLQAILLRSIIDISRCDIGQMQKWIESACKQAHYFQRHLSQLTWFESKAIPHHSRQTFDGCLEAWSGLKTQYQEAAHQVADALTNRLRESIRQLTLDKQGLCVPAIALHQISHIRQFVEQYGLPDTKKRFEEVLDLPNQWIQSLQSDPFAICQDSLKGWETLFQYYPFTPQKSKACLDLMALIRKQPSLKQQDLWVLVNQHLESRSENAKPQCTWPAA